MRRGSDYRNHENPRKIKLFFYYPSDEYISYLMTQKCLMFEDEINCRDLFNRKDMHEKVLVFVLGCLDGFFIIVFDKFASV